MKLTVLVNNNTYIDRYFLGEPALSFFIEDEEKKDSIHVSLATIKKHGRAKQNLSFQPYPLTIFDRFFIAQ